jgi:predicted MFS family arabinose efflux permease
MAVLALTVFATISATLIVPPLLVQIATDLEISVAVAGQLATATFVGWALMGVSGGPLSDSFGRRSVALVALAVLSASVLASAFAPNLEILLALRVLTGLGGGAIPPNIVRAVSDIISPARRAQAVGALLAIQGLASAITVPFVAVLADVGGWQLAFIVYGLMLVAGLLANWLWLPKDRQERVRN